jgi:hypothetical protein
VATQMQLMQAMAKQMVLANLNTRSDRGRDRRRGKNWNVLLSHY